MSSLTLADVEAVIKALEPPWQTFRGRTRLQPSLYADKGQLFLLRVPTEDFDPLYRTLGGQPPAPQYRVVGHPETLDEAVRVVRLGPGPPPSVDEVAAILAYTCQQSWEQERRPAGGCLNRDVT